jgi:hypothetical protein
MATHNTPDFSVDLGGLRLPEAGAPSVARPSPRTNGAPEKRQRRKRPIKFPDELKVSITLAMRASLQRLERRLLTDPGILGRQALIYYLTAQDPEYRED